MTMKKVFLAVILFFFIFATNTYAGGGYPETVSAVPLLLSPTPSIIITDNKQVRRSTQPQMTLAVNTSGGEILQQLVWAIIGGFIGAFIALWLDKFNNPVLEIIASEDANDDKIFPQGYIVPGRWKFFRVKIKNKAIPKIFTLFFTRETAEQLHAKITFRQINETMKGRWSATLELPAANPLDKERLANFPDPENVFAGEDALLDVFAKYEHDTEAYGWNNEAYLNDWRTQDYKLDPGDYDIEIEIAGLNTKVRKNFRAHITTTIGGTSLTNAA